MKKVLVTGATRGLGLGIAQKLAEAGYFVVATGRTPTAEIQKICDGKKGRFFPFDLSHGDKIHDFVKSVIEECGPLFGLVNNAGVGKDGVLATQHEADIRQILAVNLEAPILLAKYVVRSMLVSGGGRVINISSIIAGSGFSGLAVYGASKAGLNGFTRSLAREVGKAGITVNAVAPGYMATEMTKGLEGAKLESIVRRSPLGRLAEVKDVAGAVCYLLSDEAANVTGTTLTVDAGSTA